MSGHKNAHDLIDEIKRKRGWRFRLIYFWVRHFSYPYSIWKWNRAAKVIRDSDFYIISDHDWFRGVEAGLWPDLTED